MTFKTAKDVVVETILNEGDDGLTVEVRSYNGGAQKIQITRMIGGNFVKLGRLNLEEAEIVADAILGYVRKQ